MRRMILPAVIALPLIMSINSLALAQGELVTGTQGSSEVRFGFYVDDKSGDQSSVREYDGRNFQGWGLEDLNAYGYAGPFQYWFGGRSLITGDEDVSLDLSVRNSLGLRLRTSALTHRFEKIPGINPYLSQIINPGDGRPLSGINTAVTPNAPFGDAFLELSPDTDLVLHRRVNDFALRQYFGREEWLALNVNRWEESENGAQQALFYNSRRYSVPLGISRSTSDNTVGANVRIGNLSVLNYTVGSTEFSDGTKPVIGGTFLDNSRFPSVKTTSSVLKARTRLSDKLYFTGAHTKRDRRNLTAILPGSVPPANLGSHIETGYTNMSLSFLATNTLSLTGRWRSYELDNFVPPVPNAAAPTNFNLSRKVTSTELGASYNGIKHGFARLGLEHRNTERQAGELHPPLEGFDAESIRESTKSNIVRLGLRYNPTLRLNLSGNAEVWNTDNPAYFGEPTDRTTANLNATYTLRDNFVLYGDAGFTRDKNNETRVEGVIPTPATNADEQEARELAAGQGYRNKFSTMDIGAWYGITGKLSADLNLAKVSTDASEIWVIGFESAYPPHLPAETQRYTADNNQWSLGLNYSPKPKIRVYGRFLNSDSEGRASFSVLPGGLTLPLGWVPVDVTEKRYTIGFAYDVTPIDKLMLDFSTSDWRDRINPENDGRFNVWRLAWSTSF